MPFSVIGAAAGKRLRASASQNGRSPGWHVFWPPPALETRVRWEQGPRCYHRRRRRT